MPSRFSKSKTPSICVAHELDCPAHAAEGRAALSLQSVVPRAPAASSHGQSNLEELMEYVGHSDLQMINRYVKLLPQPRDDNAADRLNAYRRESRSS